MPPADDQLSPQALLAAIVESSQDAIVSKTLEGVITSWNAGAERMFGYTAAEAVGQHITLIIPPELHDEERTILARLRRGERIAHYETMRRTKDGRVLEVSLSISPLRDAGGRVVGASKVGRDITEQKASRRRLLEADQRKNEFLALLAHELRNPLGPIRHATDILRAQGCSAEQLEWATQIIERQVRHMARLVEDLLDVARISRGTIELRRRRLDLVTVVRSAVEASRGTIDRYHHTLSVELPARPLHMDGDETRLTQVVANLLDNAAKYTEPGGHIWISALREGPTATIRVRDTGIGIPPDVLPGIFEMFTQAVLPLERSHSGLGVGLALVERLVQLHGGTVTAHSGGPGRGSEFTVRLPLATTPAATVPVPHPAPAAAGQHCRVLLVDDNVDAAESLAILLSYEGHIVRTAHDGEAAVAMAMEFQPQVVLLDLGLPKLNGFEVAERLRALPGGAELTLVALTGWDQPDYRRRAEAAGFSHHFVKPVDLDALRHLLTERLNCAPQGLAPR